MKLRRGLPIIYLIQLFKEVGFYFVWTYTFTPIRVKHLTSEVWISSLHPSSLSFFLPYPSSAPLVPLTLSLSTLTLSFGPLVLLFWPPFRLFSLLYPWPFPVPHLPNGWSVWRGMEPNVGRDNFTSKVSVFMRYQLSTWLYIRVSGHLLIINEKFL